MRPSGVAVSVSVSASGRACSSSSIAQEATTSPASPPSVPSSRLSTNNCRAIRPRDPPSDSRTAISFCRAAARASIRFATLAQAINSTNATTPISTSSGVDALRRNWLRPCEPGTASIRCSRNACRVRASAPLSISSFTSRSRFCLKSTPRSAFACARAVPGFSRPNNCSHRYRRESSPSLPGVIRAFIVTGTKIAGAAPWSSPSKPSGATPSTVVG